MATSNLTLDGASRTGSLTSVKTSANKSWAPGDKERWDINGRLLLGFDGRRNGSDGQYAGFSVRPLADMDGKMNLDDAVFFFSQQDDWKIKIGRFEAWDMFPLNQDTFIEYSGNTANDLYSDGYGYIYMMKEGGAAAAAGGNLLFSKTVDNWYFEVNTLVEDGSSLFVDQNYHGNALENRKNVGVRGRWRHGSPAPGRRPAAIESNLVNNALRLSEPERTLGRPVKPHRLRADHELEHPEKRSAGWGGGQSEYRLLVRGGRKPTSAPGSTPFGIAWSWAISMRTIKSTSSIWPG